jgi:hypothetical protein
MISSHSNFLYTVKLFGIVRALNQSDKAPNENYSEYSLFRLYAPHLGQGFFF